LNEFEYIRPRDVDEALELLGSLRENAKIMAGGTDLVPLMRENLVTPSHVIDISNLGDLDFIKEENGLITIGAATRMRTIEQSPIVKAKIPMFAETAQLVGEIGVRNIATIGGNLVNASPAADSAPPLLTLDANVKIRKLKTERTIKLQEFFLHVKKTVLEPDELMTEVRIPIPPPKSGGAFIRLAKRGGNIISIVSAAAFLALKGNACSLARIAMGSVAPTPIRIPDAEKVLEGAVPTEERIRTAAETALGSIKPISDVRASAEYRKETSKILVRRALQEALERAKSRT
jgi:CO/xanthine dehydrogenase FAD-binding subunit